jgi:hypothetical protein
MKMKFKVTNNGPSQWQVVEIEMKRTDSVEDIEKKVTHALEPNKWTTEDSAEQEYEAVYNV